MNRISTRAVCLGAAVWAAMGFSAAARGSIVFSQLPVFHTGGGGADTDAWINGQPFWQRSAEDFILNSPATVGHIGWWSFYGTGLETEVEAPPQAQTIRIRLYDARPGDNLPGQVLFEESFGDPARVATGAIMLLGANPPEFRYDVDLPTPWQLSAGTHYWLEIAQIGLANSHYRWEYAWPPFGSRFAITSPNYPDWAPTADASGLAFELSTVPEVASLIPMAAGLLVMQRRTRR